MIYTMFKSFLFGKFKYIRVANETLSDLVSKETLRELVTHLNSGTCKNIKIHTKNHEQNRY